ncbi:MAG: OmpA family protein [Spirochaetales bacterium]|nr:OmpA family protein [Spirochaetales bacterium]
MMMRKQVLCIIFMLYTVCMLFSEEFAFIYTKGLKYKILTTVSEKVYIDGDFHHTAEIFNKAAIEHKDVKNGKGFVSALFQISEKANSGDGIFKLDEEHDVSYWIDKQGKYEVNQNLLYPLMRDVPLFPEKNLSPGDTWEAEGKEIHDFRRFKIQMPIYVPITVHYEYIKNETKGETKVAKIKLHYEIYRELPELLKIPGWHPLLIYGKVEQFFFWDIENGHPHSYEDTFDIIYVFNNNQMYEFIGTSKGEVTESPELNKEQLKDEIEKAIKDDDIKDTTVTSDDAGVTITLENINFGPESDILQPNEQEKIKHIAKILKKYPNRDILVAGHTALAGDEEGRQLLSEKRAKAVGEYLRFVGIKNSMIFKGFGARLPIADNETESGMRKNRRVEIKILEN